MQRVQRTAVSPFKVRLWKEPEIDELLNECFTADVRWAFRLLAPFSYKSDLARYCILYVHGGWYSDLGNSYLNLPPTTGLDLIVFRDVTSAVGTSYGTASSLVYSRPGSRALAEAIESVVRHCKTRWYGSNPLDPTGPNVLGKAVASAGRDLDVLVGDLIPLTPQYTRKNLAYILPDGTIVALHKSGAGGVSGLKFGNNYNHLWHQRQVYGELPVTLSPDEELDPQGGMESSRLGLRKVLVRTLPEVLRVRLRRIRDSYSGDESPRD